MREFNKTYFWLLLLASGLIFIINQSYFGCLSIAGIWLLNIAGESVFFARANGLLNFLGLALAVVFYIPFLAPTADFFGTQTRTENILLISGVVVIFLLFWAWFLRRLQKFSSVWSHMIVFSVILLLLLLSLILHIDPLAIFALRLFVCLCLRNLWYFMFAIIDSRGQMRPLNILEVITPFWNLSAVPFTIEPREKSHTRIRLIYSGIFLLISSILIGIALDLVKGAEDSNVLVAAISSYKMRPDLITSKDGYFNYYRSDLLSFADTWTICIGGFLFHLFGMIMKTNFWIGVARLCGFPVLRYIYIPFKSRTFYQVLSRTNYFYVQMITKVLMNPLIVSMTWIKSARIRISFAVFCSVFSVGMVYHFLKFPHIIFKVEILQYLQMYLGYSFYFFLIALTASLSVIWTLARPPAPEGVWRNRIRNSIYFIVYAAILSAIGDDFLWIPGQDHNFFFFRLLHLH